MEVVFSPRAFEDLNYWKKSGNKPVQNKIAVLIEAIKYSPFEGIGKPEPLKHSLSGAWSRRINREHRLVYQITGNNQIIILDILSLKGHY